MHTFRLSCFHVVTLSMLWGLADLSSLKSCCANRTAVSLALSSGNLKEFEADMVSQTTALYPVCPKSVYRVRDATIMTWASVSWLEQHHPNA